MNGPLEERDADDGEGFDPSPSGPCEEAQALALLASAGEADAADRGRVDDHLAACQACAVEAASLGATADRVAGALLAVEPSRDLSPAVLERIRGGRSRAAPIRSLPGARRRTWAAAAAAAAVLLVAAGMRPVLSGKWWWSAGPGGKEPTRAAAGPFASFADATASAGIGFRHHAPLDRLAWMAESVGSGVAAADFDGDGLPDLLFGDAWTLDGERPEGAGCRLYRNRGDGTFEDRTAASGIDVPERVHGVVAADLDNDGDRDLVLACYGRIRVLRNRGGAVFDDATEDAGFPSEPGSWFTCAAAADFDRNGVLDLFVTRYADQEGYREGRRMLGQESGREGIWRGLPVFAGPRPLAPQTDRIYRGLGGGRFEDATAAALEGQEARYGFQCVATDADGDGLVDVYVANDMQPNSLWRNLGGMRFRDLGLEAGCALDAEGKSQAGMGVAVGDAEGDGLPDILVTNFSNDHLTLYRNAGRPGRPAFADRSYAAGVGPPSYRYLGWGAVFADLDLDGEEDIVVADGHLYPNVAEMPSLEVSFPERMQVFQGLGGGAFADRTDGGARGLEEPRVHRGLATLDFDGDGRLDLVATAVGGPPALLRNTTDPAGRGWIGFRLRGTRSPRDPAGARVTVTAGGRTRTRELHLGDSFESSSEPVLRFGLGPAAGIDRALIRWPSGRLQELPPLPAGRIHEVVEPE